VKRWGNQTERQLTNVGIKLEKKAHRDLHHVKQVQDHESLSASCSLPFPPASTKLQRNFEGNMARELFVKGC